MTKLTVAQTKAIQDIAGETNYAQLIRPNWTGESTVTLNALKRRGLIEERTGRFPTGRYLDRPRFAPPSAWSHGDSDRVEITYTRALFLTAAGYQIASDNGLLAGWDDYAAGLDEVLGNVPPVNSEDITIVFNGRVVEMAEIIKALGVLLLGVHPNRPAVYVAPYDVGEAVARINALGYATDEDAPELIETSYKGFAIIGKTDPATFFSDPNVSIVPDDLEWVAEIYYPGGGFMQWVSAPEGVRASVESTKHCIDEYLRD